MTLLALMFLAFLVQEPVSASGILLATYQAGYSAWLIHGLFILATLADIILGYALGYFLRRRYSHTRAVTYISQKLGTFQESLGKYGRRIALIVFAPVIFPISALFPPLLGISFSESLLYLFLGELIFWYAPIWAVVLGVKAFGFDFRTSLYIVFGITLLIFVGKSYLRKRASIK